MVFNTQTKQSNIFSLERTNKILEGPNIDSFKAHLMADGTNILKYKLGELIYNKNMEWRYSGTNKYLRTKRGSTLYLDITLRALGAGVLYKNSINYFVWVDNEGNLKYRTEAGAISVIKTGLDSTYRHEFYFYNLLNNETLYGCNRNDGIYKITLSGGSLVYASVNTEGAWSMSYSQVSGRLFFTNGHKSFFSEVQNQTALDTSLLEDFDTDNRFLWVFPDQGDGIQRILDNGKVTFYFKDTGIWALINAEKEIDNWIQPQANVGVGTQSPDTVVYVKYGMKEAFLYLATDKTLRLFNGHVTLNSGNIPTLSSDDSLIVSKPFKKLLDAIPDAYLSKCNAYFFDHHYILNIISAEGNDIDTTIIVDVEKLMGREESDDINQPYWYYTENMEYTNYVDIDNKYLYGFNKHGYISRLLVDDIYYEEMPDRVNPTQDFRDYIDITIIAGDFVKNETITGNISGNTAVTTLDISSDVLLVKNSAASWSIGETITGSLSGATATIDSVVRRAAIEYAIYTGWYKFNRKELKLYDAYINWHVHGRWTVNFSVNSFIEGEVIPNYDEGFSFPLKPQSIGGSYFDYSIFNESYFDYGSGQFSQNVGGQGRGHYFSFGFINNNFNEWAQIYSISPRFSIERDDILGRNY
jgi:hypothetical protein